MADASAIDDALAAIVRAANGGTDTVATVAAAQKAVAAAVPSTPDLDALLKAVLKAVLAAEKGTDAPPAVRLAPGGEAAYMLPVLRNPASDRGLPLIAAFVDTGTDGTEVAYIWNDEHLPLGETADLVYAILRALPRETTGLSWARVQDIEHVRVAYADGARSEVAAVTFYSYSEGQPWDGVSSERTVTIERADLSFQDGCPLIFANTWNHTMGETNTSGLSVETITPPLWLKAYSGLSARTSADLWIRDKSRTVVPPA